MTTLETNVGDDFIREGICSFLDEIFPAWQPYYVNKHDLTTLYRKVFDEQTVLSDKFCDADVIIQAGAPVYWKIGDSTSYGIEWAEELWFKRIFKLGPKKPILNIAAGACQPYPDSASTFLSDPQCVDFARRIDAACAWTSVRDPLASQTLYALDIPHAVLPCSAFHAARRMPYKQQPDNIIGVNLMPNGGHFKLREDVNNETWEDTVNRVLPQLRKHHPLLFIAHDQKEHEFMKQFVQDGETIFLSADYRECMQAYSRCKAVLANRVHGGVCAAGFGRPAIIIGNDTRLQIADYIGLHSRYVGTVGADEIVSLVEDGLNNYRKEEERLLTLREESASRYRQEMREALSLDGTDLTDKAAKNMYWKKPRQYSGTGLIDELRVPEYHDFMTTMNCYAKRFGMREINTASLAWAYPWAWFNALHVANWSSLRILDIESGLNPMPWFLASLGAQVTVTASDARWMPQWKEISSRTGLHVDQHAVNIEDLPFSPDSFDVVTCFSLHGFPDDISGVVNQMGRVLKPGGLLAISVEASDTGGRIVVDTLAELISLNPLFSELKKSPEEHSDDCLPTIQQSSPDSYSGGAVFVRKKLLLQESVRNILIPRFDSFGDIVLMEGMLERLKALYPQAEITMLVRSGYEQLAPLFPTEIAMHWLTTDLNPYSAPQTNVVDSATPQRSATVGLAAYREPCDIDRNKLDTLLETLNATTWDLVVFTAFNRSWIDNIIASRLSDVLKMAFADFSYLEQSPNESLELVAVDAKTQEIEKYTVLLSELSCSEEALSRPRLVVSTEYRERASVFLDENGLSDQPFLVCMPAGTQNQCIKVWPVDRFAEAIAWSYAEYSFKPLLVGHESEADQVSELERLLTSRGITPSIWLGRQGDMPMLAALMERASLCLSNDSGPLHIANALTVPVVGIYGGGTFPRFLPHGNNAVGIAGDLPCFGCYWQCYFGDAPCMKLVTVSDVTAAIQRVLAGESIPGNVIRAELCVSDETINFVEKALNEAKRRAAKFYLPSLLPVQQPVDIFNPEIAQKELELHRLRNELAAVRNSLSWRCTAIVRRIHSFFLRKTTR